MTTISWDDMLLDRVEGELKNHSDKIEIQKLTPEQKLFNEYIIKLSLYRHLPNENDYPIIEDGFIDELSYL